MNDAYKQFKDFKDSQRLAKVNDRSGKTLFWYERLGQMCEDPAYEASLKFMASVTEFIEKNEYITDKQVEILERIERHPYGN